MNTKIRGAKKPPQKFKDCAKSAKTAEGTLRVWHIPQVSGEPFHVVIPVDPLGNGEHLQTARVLLRALADYDLFQYENKIKPDYANAQGLEIFEDGEWVEWYNQHGNDISEVMRGVL